ncbi:MAG: enoyl-CoA hydratase/isomerase [Kofleriaceae bacterium]
MPYQTIQVDVRDAVCYLRFDRPARDHAITDQLVDELHDALTSCEARARVIVLSGTTSAFCSGADLHDVAGPRGAVDASALYDLWQRLASGPFVSVAHVEGRANAGGVGFVAACDVALASEGAQFSLSELLFGLYPACVLPFLVRRVGVQRAHYLTLTAQAIGARQAAEWGLVDAVDANSERLVQRHVQRLVRLKAPALRAYKAYAQRLAPQLQALRGAAVSANEAMFADPGNLQAIRDYIERGVFPWEDG